MNMLYKIRSCSPGQPMTPSVLAPQMYSSLGDPPKDTSHCVYWAASGESYPVLWPCLLSWLHNPDLSFEVHLCWKCVIAISPCYIYIYTADKGHPIMWIHFSPSLGPSPFNLCSWHHIIPIPPCLVVQSHCFGETIWLTLFYLISSSCFTLSESSVGPLLFPSGTIALTLDRATGRPDPEIAV